MERQQSINDLECRGWRPSRRKGRRERLGKLFGEDLGEQVSFYAEVDADNESYTVFIRLEDHPDGPTWVVMSAEELDSFECAMNCVVL